MKKINLLLICFIAISVVFVNCSKETRTPAANKETTSIKASTTTILEASGPASNLCDLGCGPTINDAALRAITFDDPLPDTVSETIVFAAPANLEIFAQDCCIRDDVVEIWVNGCKIATVDSRPGAFGTHAGETHTVTLPAGSHTVSYINTVSNPGASGWNVSETEVAATNLVIAGCNTGVPNVMISCGNTYGSLIAACKVGAKNHGAYVSCAAHLTGSWVAAGLITSAQKDAIMSCVAKNK